MESVEGEYYVVEMVVGKRRKDHVLEYLIKWKDYEERTWEPADNLHGIQVLIDLYEQERKEERQKIKEKPNKDKKEKPIHKEQQTCSQEMGRTAKKMSRKKIPRRTDTINDAFLTLPKSSEPCIQVPQIIQISDSDDQNLIARIQESTTHKRQLRSVDMRMAEMNRIVNITQIQIRQGIWMVKVQLHSGESKWVNRQQMRQSHPTLLLQFYESLWKARQQS